MGNLARVTGSLLIGLFLTATSANSQEKSTFDSIKGSGVLRLGCVNAEPFGFKNPANDQWGGVGPAFAALIASDLDVRWECVETSWGSAPAGLQAGKFDMVVGLTVTPKRALAIDFPTGGVVYNAVGVLVRDGIDVKQWSDLDKQEIRIAVPMGSSSDTYVTSNLKNATIVRTTGNLEAIAEFVGGRADAVGGGEQFLTLQKDRIKMGRVKVPSPIYAYSDGVGIRLETSSRWKDWLSIAINHYYLKGDLSKVYRDYLVSRGVDPSNMPSTRLEDVVKERH